MTTTSQTITHEQLHTLSSEAATHGDDLQVAICDVALGLRVGPDLRLSDRERSRVDHMTVDEARELCAQAIANAEAQS